MTNIFGYGSSRAKMQKDIWPATRRVRKIVRAGTLANHSILINNSALIHRQRRDIVNNKDRQRFPAISDRDLVPRKRTHVQSRLLRHFFGNHQVAS